MSRLIRVAPILVILFTLGTSPRAPATLFTWTNVAGGSFQANANWSPNTGFPGAADTALFGSPTGAYTVTFSGSVTNGGLQVSQGTPTLGLISGQIYTISGGSTFAVGTTIGQTANLKITGGTLSLTNSNFGVGAGIGPYSGATGNMTIDGAGTTFTTNGNECDIGVSGTGLLTVQNGASALIGNATSLGANANGNGTITVTGAGSSLALGANCAVGNLGTGTVNINNGATATIGSGLFVASFPGSTGTISVGQTGAGTLTLNGAVIGDGATTNGNLNVNSGSTLNSNGAVTIAGGGTVTLNGTWNQTANPITVQGGTLNLNNGTLTASAAGTGITVTSGTVNFAGSGATVLNLTRSGSGAINLTNGTLTVTGTFNNGNSSQTINGNSASDFPQLVLDGGATTSNLTDVFVGANRRGSLTVNNGSTLNASTLQVASGVGGNGTVFISGTNSKIQLGALGFSFVGNGGTGALSIGSGATLNFSNGFLYAGANAGSAGSIDVNGGTVVSSGQLTIGSAGVGTLLVHNGGTVTQTNSAAYIGANAGSAGTATVVGTGSAWSAGNVYVGVSGTGSLTVQAGGTVTSSSTSFVGSNGGAGTVNLSGGSWTSNGGFTFGDIAGTGGTGVVHVNQGGTLGGGGPVALYPGGTLDIAGGTVNAGSIGANGGRVTWSSGLLGVGGSLTLDNTTFGTGITLGTPQTLGLPGTLTVPSGQMLTLAGGSVGAGSIAGPGTYNLQTGSFTVTNSNLTIGSGGVLGSTVTVGPGLSLATTGSKSIVVNSDGLLLFTGGNAAGAGGITNAGEIQFASAASTLSSPVANLNNSGRIDGTSRISASLNNIANGVIAVDAGQRLVFSGSTNTNASNGSIEITGGTIEFTNTLVNASNGLISGRGVIRGSTANVSGTGLSNSGAVAFSAGTTDIYGRVANGPGAQIVVAGGGILTFHDDVSHNGTEIRTVAGARTVFFGAESGAGPFTGTGTVEMQGDLRPGNSPASVPFAGDLILAGSTNLHAEIGGTTLGSQYDHLQVAGQVAFAGNLDAQLINGFTPQLGQRFDIVTFGTRQGSFGSFTGLNLGGGLVFTPDYDANHFYLAVTPPAATGLSTWTGTTSGSWNDPSNWAPTGVPASSINTQLVFGVTPNAAMTNDIAGTFILNQLNFFSVAPIYSLAGNRLDFRTNASAVPPQIVLNSTNGVTISAPLTLTNSLSIVGVGNLALNGAISGAGSLTYSGLAVLSIGGSGSTYTGGTIVNLSAVRTTATNSLPAGGLVTVIGGTLDLNGFNQLIGALTLSDPTTTNASVRPVVSSASAAVLTLGGNITYSPGSSSPSAKIGTDLNVGGATRSINVTSASGDPYDVVITGHVTGAGGLTKAGPGSLVLTNTSSYTGATTISGGTLVLATINALPATSPVVLSAGALLTASPPASTAEVIAGNYNQTLGSLSGPASSTAKLLSGTLTLGSDNTDATFAGTLNLPGSGLVKIGNGTQTLSGVNSQISTTVNGGTLAVTTDTALGAVGSPVAVNAFGTLTYSGTTTTAGRAFTLNSGTITVAAGQTATLSGDTIAGGFLGGPGTFAFTGGTALSGGTTVNSAVVNQTGAASFANFSNGGALTVAAGSAIPASFTRFTNQGSGSITVAAASAVHVSDFQSYGLLTLNPAVVGSGQVTLLANTGTSPMFFNGGSRTFIGTPATAANNVAGVDLGGHNLVVAGGLFVNNGFVADSTGTPGSVIVDYGALYKGAGTNFVSVITQNGGRVQAGNSPGSMGFGRFVFGPGGVSNYVFAIDDAIGTAGPSPDALGHVSGWGLVNAIKASFGSITSSGDFLWTATPSGKLTFAIDTLVNPTTVGIDVPGMMDHFDPTQSYSWPAAHWAGTYSGPTDAAALDAATSFDTSGFLNPVAGTFGWSLDLAGQTLSLTYAPSAVPEPGTLALVAIAGVGIAWRRRRRFFGHTV